MKSFNIFLVFSLIVFALGSMSQAEELDSSESEQTSISKIEDDADCCRRGPFTHIKRRTDRPFQAHVVMTGGGWRHGSHGPGGGVYLGYQISDLMAIGVTSQVYYNDKAFWHDWDEYGYDNEKLVLGQEGVKETVVEIDPRHLVEMRFFPFDFGLYFSAGILHVGKQTSTIEFKKRTRTIGENEYNTGLKAVLEYEAWTGAAAGIGFNHIFRNGVTLGVGFNAGLGVLNPETTLTSTSTVSDADMEDWRDQIDRNEKMLPYMFQFGVGYAF